MAYCTEADLEELMDMQFDATTEPTSARVVIMIADVASEIDGVLRAAGYSPPITATDALGLLRKMNSFGAAPTVFHAAVFVEQEPPKVAYWRSVYDGFIARIRKGEQQLPGLDPEADIDPVFAITPSPQREEYWLTDQDITV
jgi:hypothetical protein